MLFSNLEELNRIVDRVDGIQEKARKIVEKACAAAETALNQRDEARTGLAKIILMNRKNAQEKYGNAELAEGWACVRVARSILEGLPMPSDEELETIRKGGKK